MDSIQVFTGDYYLRLSSITFMSLVDVILGPNTWLVIVVGLLRDSDFVNFPWPLFILFLDNLFHPLHLDSNG